MALAMAEERVRVTAVSDYICPWCYVGMARLERVQRAFELEVTWHPFELHPGIPQEGRELGRRAEYYLRFLPIAAGAGLTFQPPARVPNSHLALEAAEFAREQGAFDSYHRAVFEAYFAHERNIGDPAVLAELAGETGLDARALRDALESKRYASLVDERTEEAKGWEVSATPTFIFESGERRFALSGAQDDAVFESVAQRMGAARRTAPLGAAGRSPERR